MIAGAFFESQSMLSCPPLMRTTTTGLVGHASSTALASAICVGGKPTPLSVLAVWSWKPGVRSLPSPSTVPSIPRYSTTWSAAFAAAIALAKPLVSFESTVVSAFTVVTAAVEALLRAWPKVWTQSKVSFPSES